MEYFIIRTNGSVERGDVDEADDNAQMRLWESVSDGYFEHIRVFWGGKYCSMLVTEQGRQKELPLNEMASKIYWNKNDVRVHDPGQYDPRIMDPIVGDVILFDGLLVLRDPARS
jgi:hypothetical protein